MGRLPSYQGIPGTAFADAHLLSNRFKVLIELQIFQASLERLHGDVISAGGEAEKQSYPQKTAVNQSTRQQVKNWSVPLPQVQWGTTNVVLFKFIIVVRSLDRDYIFTGNSNCYFTPGRTDDLDVCPVRFLEERYGTRLNTGCLNCKYWVKTEKYAERL